MSTSITLERKMIDIHMHLIPGVDDGAEDMMMARMMLLRAREQGIHAIFVPLIVKPSNIPRMVPESFLTD